MLTDKQQGVLRGMVSGVIATLLALTISIVAHEPAFESAPGYPAALVHALTWDVLIVVCLLVNIGLLARHRFFTPDDIDGGGLTGGTPQAQILQSTLQNTLEQTVLAVSVHALWAVAMPHAWQAAVPAAAILFFVGRVLFWRGYARGAPARALGFALTFYPSVVMVFLIVGRLLLGLVW
ncbi:MAPEG family protein [Accumulibacter sp.]|uniref:MAPEG family protein n=1 Tax=Accumulibacter sp. TaxID=2053492 RepID=UPI0025F3CA5D|nr:MAPEG family protein [Accumulibacter sp.]MCM8611635.1 MAPEG family protein [Accumulibacter sp.]MCM8635659.1 MAPEG family protein [Accumulibacter sp.]MCM8639222.1 MAPEG family protein [Accumulibacter sp.]